MLSRMHGDYFHALCISLWCATEAPGNFIFATWYSVCNEPRHLMVLCEPSAFVYLHEVSSRAMADAVDHWHFTPQMPGFSPTPVYV
jgi:hypothetical protein